MDWATYSSFHLEIVARDGSSEPPGIRKARGGTVNPFHPPLGQVRLGDRCAPFRVTDEVPSWGEAGASGPLDFIIIRILFVKNTLGIPDVFTLAFQDTS